MMIAPASLRDLTTGASPGATLLRKCDTPRVVALPSRSIFSFRVIGTPYRGPGLIPFDRARSASFAASNASLVRSTVTALRSGLTLDNRAAAD